MCRVRYVWVLYVADCGTYCWAYAAAFCSRTAFPSSHQVMGVGSVCCVVAGRMTEKEERRMANGYNGNNINDDDVVGCCAGVL